MLGVRPPSDAGAGVVVFNEAFDPGWRATVDGEPAPIERVNLLHRGVVVPAGAHDVELRYAPPGVRPLWWLWLLTLLGCAGVGLDALRR